MASLLSLKNKEFDNLTLHISDTNFNGHLHIPIPCKRFSVPRPKNKGIQPQHQTSSSKQKKKVKIIRLKGDSSNYLVKYQNGDIYKGPIENGLREGRGCYRF